MSKYFCFSSYVITTGVWGISIFLNLLGQPEHPTQPVAINSDFIRTR